MASPLYARSLVCATKRLKLSPSNAPSIPRTHTRCIQTKTLPPAIEEELSNIRLPRAVQAAYLAPLKRLPTHNVTTCDLQLRSYSVRNLEVFTDFALRAAYFLGLPAAGPVPLPKITERWTVTKSVFVHKKAQENFERITLRRLVQIKDGHPDTVSKWLEFLKKYHYYGVGMKANVYDYSGLDVTKDMDAEAERIRKRLGEILELTGMREQDETKMEEKMEDMLFTQPFKAQWGADAPMGGNQDVPAAHKSIARYEVEEKERR